MCVCTLIATAATHYIPRINACTSTFLCGFASNHWKLNSETDFLVGYCFFAFTCVLFSFCLCVQWINFSILVRLISSICTNAARHAYVLFWHILVHIQRHQIKTHSRCMRACAMISHIQRMKFISRKVRRLHAPKQEPRLCRFLEQESTRRAHPRGSRACAPTLMQQADQNWQQLHKCRHPRGSRFHAPTSTHERCWFQRLACMCQNPTRSHLRAPTPVSPGVLRRQLSCMCVHPTHSR